MKFLMVVLMALCLAACPDVTGTDSKAGPPGGRGAGSSAFIQNASCSELENAIVNPARYVGRFGNYETEVFIRASATYAHQCGGGGDAAAK
jgi:hypothetical protein